MRMTPLHRRRQRRADDRRRNRCVLEVNTSAVYRGFRKDFFPSDAILKEWLVLSDMSSSPPTPTIPRR